MDKIPIMQKTDSFRISGSNFGVDKLTKVMIQNQGSLFQTTMNPHIAEKVLEDEKRIAAEKFRYPGRIETALVH